MKYIKTFYEGPGPAAILLLHLGEVNVMENQTDPKNAMSICVSNLSIKISYKF